MKRNFFYLLFFAALLIAAYFFVYKKQWGTLKVDETAFSIADTAAVSKIFIADMQGEKVLLQRQKNFWLVNEKYSVRSDYIISLLSTIKNLAVDHPVPDAAQSNVLKEMASHNKRVEIYDHEGKLIKAYNVGGASLDALGTYMLMDGAKKAYVVAIPGFQGVLQTRYSTDEQKIRATVIYQLHINEISNVSVAYTAHPDSSFQISVLGTDSFVVQNEKGKSLEAGSYDLDKVISYLNCYKFVSVEAFVNDLAKKDTILQTTPYCTISVTERNKTQSQVVIYYMPKTQRTVIQFDQSGNPVQFDNDRYFATINNGNDFVIIQQFHFGRLFKNFNYFIRKKSAGR